MAFPDEVDLILHIGIDECADAVWLIPENVIGAPANDDTGFLGGNLTDDILFIFEQSVIEGSLINGRVGERTGKRIGGNLVCAL